jgi:CRISPR/Cas system-associated endonuclease Cas1
MTEWFSLKRLFGRAPSFDPNIWPVRGDFDDAEEAGKELSPAAAPVHVLSGSALVRIDNGLLVVERQDQDVTERPMELVLALHIHGWATITSPCVRQLVAQGTSVVWRGATGFPIAAALPMHLAGVKVRRAQYAGAGSSTALDIARSLVAAKIVNMRGLVRRRATLSGCDHLSALHKFARRARFAPPPSVKSFDC